MILEPKDQRKIERKKKPKHKKIICASKRNEEKNVKNWKNI